MQNLRSKITFIFSALLYLLFNLRVTDSVSTTMTASFWQILTTAPYVAGFTYVIIAMLQYMADGDKLPWDRRLRLFFAIGIIAGLLFAIYEYAGVDVR
jgi:hypothetical protein